MTVQTSIKPSPSAYAAWEMLWRAGFDLRADGDRLLVSPSDGLVESTRDFIRERKTDLLAVCRRLDDFGRVCGDLNDQAAKRWEKGRHGH